MDVVNQGITVLEVTYDLDWFSILSMLVLLLVVSGVVYVATKFDRRALSTLALGASLFLLLLVVFSYSFLQRQAAVSDANRKQVAVKQHSAVKSLVSTEQMWEHLNRSRIVLDDDQSTDEAKPEEEKAPITKKPAKQKRPAWVDIPPKRVGNVYRVAISSESYRDVEECHQALVPELLGIVQQRISQLTTGSYPPSLDELGLSVDFILREICHEEWVESVEASFGEMKRVHVQLEFDTAIDKRLRTAVRDYQRQSRISQVGGVAGLSLGGLALLFGLLKVDTWTRGYYTKRLFLGVPAAIIGILLLFIT